jgi:hypothetical protein
MTLPKRCGVCSDAQRLAVRRASTAMKNGTALLARPHQLKLGHMVLMARLYPWLNYSAAKDHVHRIRPSITS